MSYHDPNVPKRTSTISAGILIVPKISVCIPAYNRPEVLPDLLDSIARQDYADFDVVICEDMSPERDRIRAVVEEYRPRIRASVLYFENDRNLGYDGNIRELIARADGDYCLFMGNDDVLCPDAIRTAAEALDRYPNVGVLLRGWAMFRDSPTNIVHTSRYFDAERFFPAGTDTVVTFFRRSVVLPGLILQRKKALEFATDRYDGTTLYQIYVSARILGELNGLFVPSILALRRDGIPPDFGVSAAERGKYVPGEHTTQSSVNFLEGFLAIAADIGKMRGERAYRRIIWDVANYSYPFLWMHADKRVGEFTRYAFRLARLGLWRSPLFYVYYLSLVVLGPDRMQRLTEAVKRYVGSTPVIGRVYQGERARNSSK